jgi:sterol desaturase/sphingolipid hydroxylase (fatty acid hydroxylase superfamily)
MIAVLLSILISLVVTTLFGYLVHKALHQKWMGRFCKAHMTHHMILYPPENYTSEVYKHAGKDSTIYFFAVASIPMILIPIVLGLLGILAWHLVVIVIVTELLLGFVHNYLHDAFHIKDHWLNKMPVISIMFSKWNRLHYIHHVNMKLNYGIFTFFWDRVFGTYKK